MRGRRADNHGALSWQATGRSACARYPAAIPTFLVASLGAVLALHFFEPEFAITWSYAHLGRRPWLPWLAGALVVALPLAVRAAWQHPASRRRLRPWSPARVLAAWTTLFVVLLALAIAVPAPQLSTDPGYFVELVKTGNGQIARWHLLLMAYQTLGRLLGGVVGPVLVIRGINALLASLALLALAASARRLSASRGEALAMTTLAWTAFGTLQLTLGYTDVYVVPLAMTALYCWLGLEAIVGERHPVWALGLAAIGPFVYIGLVLLVPSLVVILGRELRRPGGGQRIAAGAVVALMAAAAATLPRFGEPFALRAFVEAVTELPAASMGVNTEGYQLPLSRILRLDHAVDVTHVLLLVDCVGWLLVLGPGLWIAMCRPRGESGGEVSFLALLILPFLAYVIAMDPLYGAYMDWDLFSYGAVGTSLLGGYTFVLWGRAHRREFGLLLGLALATAAVHNLARLNTMHLDRVRHRLESPPHVRVERRDSADTWLLERAWGPVATAEPRSVAAGPMVSEVAGSQLVVQRRQIFEGRLPLLLLGTAGPDDGLR